MARRPDVSSPGAVREDDAPVIVLEGVTFRYPGAVDPALDAVSLAIRPGEAVVVAGESGSGKSTLARLVTGLLRATAGRVRTGGLDAGTARRQDLAAIAGLVFQHPNHQLFASTVRDELAIGPRNLGVAADEIDGRVAAIAQALDLEPVLDVHPYRLGIGVRKRVALGAVLAMQPGVVLLDEPTTGQDRPDTDRLAGVLHDELARGTTLVVITHDLRFAAAVAERLVVLRAGGIVADGRMAEVLGDEAVLASTGLEAPQLVRLAARLGLDRPNSVPLGEAEIAGLLARRGALPPRDGVAP